MFQQLTMSKRNKSNRGDNLIDEAMLYDINQKIKELKQQWSSFKKNKEWILSLLFVCSIIHSILQYGLFGINILEFYTLTDYFMNFAEVFVPFILLIPLWILLTLLPDGKIRWSIWTVLCIKIIVFVFSTIMISMIFQNNFGVLAIIYILALLGLLYNENKKVLTDFFIIFLLLFSIGLPIEKRLSYKVNTALVDRLSFSYSEMIYDLSDIDHYLYIGGSLDYFFIYDKYTDKVNVISKTDCKNINRKPFYWGELWKSETYYNTNQREYVKRRKIKCK